MKHIRILILVAALALALPATALAEHLTGASNWSVTYTAAGEMEDTYSDTQFADEVGGLQPGDDITFTVNLSHENADAADWYMSNEVLKTLEEGAATGSAYGYRLTYDGPSGSRTLYDSEAVGGDDSNGLMDATNALEDYLFLDTFSKGDAGMVQLRVSLDGETEGNDYFDTIARVKMQFAVEPVEETGGDNPPRKRVIHKTITRTVVQTGDETDLFPFYIAMAASGALLLALGLYGVRSRKRDEVAVGNHAR